MLCPNHPQPTTKNALKLPTKRNICFLLDCHVWNQPRFLGVPSPRFRTGIIKRKWWTQMVRPPLMEILDFFWPLTLHTKHLKSRTHKMILKNIFEFMNSWYQKHDIEHRPYQRLGNLLGYFLCTLLRLSWRGLCWTCFPGLPSLRLWWIIFLPKCRWVLLVTPTENMQGSGKTLIQSLIFESKPNLGHI